MISTEDLEFLTVVSGCRTLAEAARALNVSPPSVTLRLQHIESKLSVSLIQRPSRVVSLTEEGKLLVDKGLVILRHIDELEEQLSSIKNTVTGKLRVLAPLGFGNEYVAHLLAEYKIKHQKLDIELELSDQPNWSTHHKWDIIIYIGVLKDSSLKMITLANNDRFICASPVYIEKYGEPKHPRDLLNHACIALRENNEDVTLWEFENNKGEHTTVRINPCLSCNEGRVVKDWAEAGLGIIMRSEWDVTPELRSGSLVRLLPDYKLPSADIVALVSSSEAERSARVSGFIEILKESLTKYPWKNGVAGCQ
ncbi:LysR family transcriptional regulator [Nitrincola sp. MINF-07-Sa-05]|uniref:LysR family transcriptional regulator n=1 Tax=Nitrincola salilacus TaxID=3400273 RepID=UPI003917DA98